MNHVAISSLLVVMTSLANCIFVFFSPARTTLKKIWSLFNLLVFLWAIGTYGLTIANNPAFALSSTRFANFVSFYIPVVFLHFVFLLTDQIKQNYRVLLLHYLFVTIYFFIVILFPQLYMPSVSPKLSIQFWGSAGSIYFIFPLFYAWIVFFSLYNLYQCHKTSAPQKQNQIKYVALGTGVAFLGGSTCFFLIFDIPIYPFGIYFIPIYVITVTYAIIKHKLMDIQIVIRKSLVYSTLIAILTLSYLLIVLVAEKFLRDMVGYHSLLASTLMAFFVGIFFFPLRNKIQYAVDRYFFKGTQVEIAEQNVLLRREVADKEKFKAVATMASGMAHEIRNPLTAIKTFSEFLPQKMEDKEFLAKFSRIVGREVDRVNSLVTNLLEFARPSPLQIKEVNLHALLSEILNYLNNEFLRSRIKAERNFDEGNPLILQADPNQLRQVFLNLFINAIQAMPQGGTLTVRSEAFGVGNQESGVGSKNQSFISGLRTSNSNLRTIQITIQDTGCGIDPKDVKRVFDPFFTKKEKGTGLGLAIVQGIIEEHKGKIRVESEVGKGTSFILEFPGQRY